MRFVILKTTVGDRQALQRTLEAHHNYLESLRQRKVLLLAGTFDDRTGGLLLLETSGVEQAIAIARSDPLVQAGVDRYLVRGWRPLYDPADGTVGGDTQQMKLPLSHIDTGPIELPPCAENFRVIEAEEHPRHDELLAQCFAPNCIAADDVARRDYLRRARGMGLRKLLLLHHDLEEVAGQIEFGPPEAAGIPIDGESLTVINCIWVLDTYSRLGGGQLLLAACADRTATESLATVAFNTTLPFLSRRYFEHQGFNVIDHVETGRFFGNTPVVAYLLWRPLVDTAAPPTWDTGRLLEGLSFCPRYPWMSGRRRYWGQDFAYHGTVVWEGLRRPEVLAQFPRLGRRRVGNWTLVKIGFPEADLPGVIERLQAALVDEPTYFANLYGGHDDRLIVVFPKRVFRMSRDRATWGEALRYGVEKGIPEQELVFGPGNFEGGEPVTSTPSAPSTSSPSSPSTPPPIPPPSSSPPSSPRGR